MSGCLSPPYLNWTSSKHSLEEAVDSLTSMVVDKALTMGEVAMVPSMVAVVLGTSNTSTSTQR